MKRILVSLLAAGSIFAGAAAPASAAPATCEIFGTPVSGGACVQFERDGKLTGGAYVQNCRMLTGGQYPFTFYPEGPLPTRVADNQGECKQALRYFHGLMLG